MTDIVVWLFVSVFVFVVCFLLLFRIAGLVIDLASLTHTHTCLFFHRNAIELTLGLSPNASATSTAAALYQLVLQPKVWLLATEPELDIGQVHVPVQLL